MKKQIEHFDRPLELKDVTDSGVFVGYASVFGNVDHWLDIVDKGAFKATLKSHESRGRFPPLLWMHKQDSPLGKFTDMREDDNGLLVEGQLALGTQAADEAHVLMKMKALDGMSIGYWPVKWSYDEKTDVRILQEVELVEASLVTIPANDKARVSSVKSIIESSTEFKQVETILRDAGFSRSECGALVSRIKSIALRDAESTLETAVKLRQLAASMKS
jgi:HK97 family phage prohead protease